jgi:hypothetical protein
MIQLQNPLILPLSPWGEKVGEGSFAIGVWDLFGTWDLEIVFVAKLSLRQS